MISTSDRSIKAHNVSGGLNKLWAGLLGITYATILASLPLTAFQDRENYLIYAEDSLLILARYAADGPLAILVNEPLWLLLNAGMALALSPEETLRVIVFLPAFVVAYCLLQSNPQRWIWLIVFLLLPQLLKNHITHLRQGLAIAVFMASLLTSSWKRGVLMALTPFIHSSFFFVVMLWLADKVFRPMRIGIDVRSVLIILGGIAMSLSLGIVANVLGDRRADTYDFMASDMSGLGFVFWIIILSLMVAQGKKWMSNNAFPVYSVLFYLVSYPLIEVSGRIFESSLPIVLLACVTMSRWRRMTFGALIMVYWIVQWIMRFGRTPMF